ncbi:MAG: ATP-binding cassette domain-containing protein [Gammaproteobacteria bacterium]|nr:ATP-binding cassette domain-containing protein [Gammaproteobacteria bacterium]
MILARLAKAFLAYGMQPLLDNADFQIESGERVALLGRNGEGKSTLLKLIAGDAQLDSGELWKQPDIRITRLNQDLEWPVQATVYDVVAQGFGEIGEWIGSYHALTRIESLSKAEMDQLSALQHKIDAHNGWDVEARINNYLQGMGLAEDRKISELSGGMQRRVSMSGALVAEPDLLLLDEPTNHLDIEAIDWLEQQCIGFSGGILFVTHDRTFLGNLATRIIDLDRGQLTSWPGNYDTYQRRKAEALDAQAKAEAEFDKKLAAEEVWIRQGIKARRTRNEGRVRALKKMRSEHSQRRVQQGTVNFSVEQSVQSGKLVIEAKHISFCYDDKPIFKDFSTVIMRGDKVGLIGPNGIGKTTLLNVFLQQQKPDKGKLKLGTNLEIAYSDQLRAQLDPQQSIIDCVGEGRDMLTIGKRTVHVMTYLQEFLFSPQRVRQPLSSLSGGEKNRVMLARLFTKPANLLVLDEPTNDLDVETLEILEDLLVSFEGTVLLVSHDRTFLDNVVTSSIVFEGNAQVNEYVGGYSDWLRQRQKPPSTPAKTQLSTQTERSKPTRQTSKQNKLSYKQQLELDELPEKIAELESQQNEFNELISKPDFYNGNQEHIKTTLEKAKAIEQQLEQAYTRWDELESLQESFSSAN